MNKFKRGDRVVRKSDGLTYTVRRAGRSGADYAAGYYFIQGNGITSSFIHESSITLKDYNEHATLLHCRINYRGNTGCSHKATSEMTDGYLLEEGQQLNLPGFKYYERALRMMRNRKREAFVVRDYAIDYNIEAKTDWMDMFVGSNLSRQAVSELIIKNMNPVVYHSDTDRLIQSAITEGTLHKPKPTRYMVVGATDEWAVRQRERTLEGLPIVLDDNMTIEVI